MDKSDNNITVDGNLLTISAVKEHKETTEQENFTNREFSYQSFQRRFELPKDMVGEEQIRARYENGFLLLTVPKRKRPNEDPRR